MKKFLTRPILALAALATVGAGAGVGALASAQTATSTDASVQTIGTRPDRGMPGVHGKITAISGNTITISDERAGTTYTVDASSATVMKAAQGSTPTTATVSALVVGDMVGVEGTVSGTNVSATKIMSGFMGGHGMGFGGHRGHGVMGTVSAVSGNTITVTNQDGTSYTIDASNATVSKMVTTSVSDITVGERINADGTISGTNVAATRSMTGLPEKPADVTASGGIPQNAVTPVQ
ncbi:MAG: DUF5666 domain-containing protein [Patescibacteria group bacterium]